MFINDVLFFEGVSDSLCNFGAPDLSNKEEVFDRDTVPVDNFLLTGTVLVNNPYLPGASQMSQVLAGHASGCWRSALGAGVPYNRDFGKFEFGESKVV